MGTGKWVKEGAGNLADIYFKNEVQNVELYLGLVANNISSALEDAVLATIVEPTAATYARIILAPATWVIYDAVSTYPEVAYTPAEDFGVIYGCFISTTVDNSGKLLAIYKFDSAITLNNGDRLGITPRMVIS